MLKIILIITTQQRQRPPHPSRPASQEALPHAAFISGKHCSSEKGSRATPPPPPPPPPHARQQRRARPARMACGLPIIY